MLRALLTVASSSPRVVRPGVGILPGIPAAPSSEFANPCTSVLASTIGQWIFELGFRDLQGTAVPEPLREPAVQPLGCGQHPFRFSRTVQRLLLSVLGRLTRMLRSPFVSVVLSAAVVNAAVLPFAAHQCHKHSAQLHMIHRTAVLPEQPACQCE